MLGIEEEEEANVIYLAETIWEEAQQLVREEKAKGFSPREQIPKKEVSPRSLLRLFVIVYTKTKNDVPSSVECYTLRWLQENKP